MVSTVIHILQDTFTRNKTKGDGNVTLNDIKNVCKEEFKLFQLYYTH